MFENIRHSKLALRFSIIGVLICAGYYILETVNGRNQMADFRVYYDACNAFLGDTQLYGLAFGVGSGFYKYSPFATIPFIPLAVLSYKTASILFYVIITLCIIGWSLWLINYFNKNLSSGNSKNHLNGWILAAISIFMADHIERELHLGNVNLFLLIGAAAVYHLKSQKPWTAGAIYGLMLLFKPHFLILLPYFVWKKEWKVIGGTVGMFGLGLIVPALSKGWSPNIALHQDWLAAIRDHNVVLYESPSTIYGIVNRFILGGNGGSWLVLAGLVVVGALFLLLIIRNRNSEKFTSSFLEFFILVALIPNLAHTDTEHFMWTWPLVGYVVWHLFKSEIPGKWIYILAMVAAFIPYCLNSPDIVGRDIRYLFDEGGLLGVANLIIIAVAILIFKKSSSENPRLAVS
ncbi:MAG: glycosyltransferase family 87 protein [Flavobacteriales bacterium]